MMLDFELCGQSGNLRSSGENCILFPRQFNCVISIKTIDSEAACKIV